MTAPDAVPLSAAAAAASPVRRQVVPGAPGVGFALSGRAGGVSRPPYDGLNLGSGVGDDPEAVRRNRALVAAGLGVGADRMVWMHQVHGRDVAVVEEPPATQPPHVDAVVTRVPGLVLAVMVADCTPLLLADPAARLVAAVHVGRAGLVAGVVPAAVDVLVDLGAVPERVRAVTGPAICGGCYEVPAAMRAEVAAVVPAAWATTRQGTPAVDVTAGVWAQLADAGVPPGERSAECTRETPAYFSHRAAAPTGRFAAFVWLEG